MTARTKIAPIRPPAGVKQVWCGDYGHEPAGFPGQFVKLRETGF